MSSSSGSGGNANGSGGWNWAALSQQATAQNASQAAESQQRVVDRVRQAASEAARRRPASAGLSTAMRGATPPPPPAPSSEAASLPAPATSPDGAGAKDADRERFSGLRIADRTISADDLAGEMTGRRFIPLREMDSVPRDVLTDEKTDWVTIGVVARKTLSKATTNGSTFMVWGLSDLDTTELGVFLFDAAYEAHWRQLEGSLVAVLNATLMPASEKNKFALKAARPEEVVKLGRAVDFGICKAMTSAENRCRLAVNTATSQYCMHHLASSFLAAGKRRQQLNNTAATFHKSLFGAKNQVKNISAGVYGVRPSGATNSSSGWQPILSNKRKRDSGAGNGGASATLGVPTVLSARASPATPSLSPLPSTSTSSSSTAAVLLGQRKRKKVDMIKFMRSGSAAD
ncbi:hypothetical protein ATCC90586_007114 [Pythium insidiosum]|nr:hypothetical protein ATCC90586_007114 [Pythium insidiosum]